RSFFAAPLAFECPNGCLLRGAIAIDRQLQFLRERQQPANMVAVLVRDKNASEIFGRAADGCEAVADLPRAEPGIDEDAGFIGLDISAISRGTAAKNCKTNRHG